MSAAKCLGLEVNAAGLEGHLCSNASDTSSTNRTKSQIGPPRWSCSTDLENGAHAYDVIDI